MIRNQKGAVALTILTLLPLILGVGFVAIAVFYVIRTHSSNLHTCRSHLLDTEESRLETMRELVKMNSGAKKLRTARKLAEKKVEIAWEAAAPMATAAAEAELALVIAAQTAFSIVQKGLIAKADATAVLSFARLRSSLVKDASSDLKIYDSKSQRPLAVLSTTFTPLPVVPQQADTPTPDYQPDPKYSDKEVLRMTWKLWPARLLPSWLSFSNSFFQNLTIEGQCASTGEKKGNHQWRARLTADKQRLN